MSGTVYAWWCMCRSSPITSLPLLPMPSTLQPASNLVTVVNGQLVLTLCITKKISNCKAFRVIFSLLRDQNCWYMICVGRSDFWICEFNIVHSDLDLCPFILQHFALMPLTIYITFNSLPHHFCFNTFCLCTRILLRVYKTLGTQQGWGAVCSVIICGVVIWLYFTVFFVSKHSRNINW